VRSDSTGSFIGLRQPEAIVPFVPQLAMHPLRCRPPLAHHPHRSALALSVQMLSWEFAFLITDKVQQSANCQIWRWGTIRNHKKLRHSRISSIKYSRHKILCRFTYLLHALESAGTFSYRWKTQSDTSTGRFAA